MGKKYLYPAPPEDVTLFESDKCGVVLPADLFESIGVGKWKKLSVDRLKVIDPPLDDLGELEYP